MRVAASLSAVHVCFQLQNRISPAGICRIISCILHNDNLDDESRFGHTIYACLHTHTWAHEQLDRADQRQHTPTLQYLRSQFNYRLIMCLVVSAAAASPVFGPRSFRASQLQPPPQLGIRLVCCRQGIDHDLTRLLAQAARHPHLQETRLQLLCSGCPLSILAARLASCIRHDGRRYCELKMIAYIMRRCIGKRFDCYRQPRSVHSGSHSFISWQ